MRGVPGGSAAESRALTMAAATSGGGGAVGVGVEESVGVGGNSSPPRAAHSGGSVGGGGDPRDICRRVFDRLVADGHVEAVAPEREFRARLKVHFDRLPASYQLYLDVDKAEEVLIHEKVLAEAKDPAKRPAFHVRYLGLSALLSDIGLNIREAHVFSTTDGYSLYVFVVDGWLIKDIDVLNGALEASILRDEGSWSGSGSSPEDTLLPFLTEECESDIDISLLDIGEKVANGSYADLFLGTYCNEEVAIKVLDRMDVNQIVWNEFKQEIYILREVDHANIVRYIGSCTKTPKLCIITEYMTGGNLFNFLHNEHNVLDLPTLLKFVLDVCRGSGGTRIFLSLGLKIRLDRGSGIGDSPVVKVADFGLARFHDQDDNDIRTAETGTYRWMAPDVINHEPYNNKADVYSFAIVLWEFMTSKIPYNTMSPLQAAVGVRQGLRPPLPEIAHPRLLILMQRCWEAVPSCRPSFSDIITELEDIRTQTQGTSGETSQKQKDDPRTKD